MRNVLSPFFIAIQFLTRLPVSFLLKQTDNQDDIYTADNMGRTLKYYPVVGSIIGIALILLILVLQIFAQYHTFYIAGLVVALWVLMTGGLHLDGVADMADAWVGGLGDKDKTLKIMKDPVCGPFAVIAIVFVILFKLIMVFELLNINFYLIFVAPFLSRTGVVILLMTTPYVRDNGLGSSLIFEEQKRKNIISIVAALLTSITILIFLTNILISLATILASVLFYYLFRMKIMSRLDGITGDVAGAFIEYAEVIILFSLVTLLIK